MKEVLEFVDQKKQEFAQLPLFKFLHDSTIDPRQRLSFAPIFAPFVMGFGELNSFVFREEPTDHPIQLLVNQHSREDDSHWVWFIEDLKQLGIDVSMRFTDTLKFLWGKDTHASRHAIYELYRHTYKAPPLQKLVVIEAVEAIADVFLEATSCAAHDLQAFTNQDYPYFGDLHVSSDSTHTLYLPEVKQRIEDLQLTAEAKREAFEFVEQVFQMFEDYFAVIFTYAKNQEISLPKDLTAASEEIADPAWSGKRLGSYLVEAGLLTSKQLEAALGEQEGTDKRLGEVVSAQGWVNQQTIEYLMEKVIMPDRETALERSLSLVS
jgi:hypothetical protein